MRASVKLSLTGILIAGTLAFSAVGAYARGGNANGPDAFIGIVGGSPQAYGYSAGGDYPGGGYQANTGHPYQNGYGHGGYGNITAAITTGIEAIDRPTVVGRTRIAVVECGAAIMTDRGLRCSSQAGLKLLASFDPADH